jgi:YebC/PmpR family DNA-binding regulatory protein
MIMAGHSKWANIQHRKGSQDARRGKLFTKLIREITVATRMGGGGDANTNPRLRAAIDKALSNNMTRDTVERAIKRGLGPQDVDNYEEIRYEGYGPGGIAIMVDCMTDNRNRTVSDVRHALTKFGGNLGTDGSVGYLFEKTGQLFYPVGSDEDKILEIALEAGAQDIVNHADTSLEVFTSPDSFMTVKAALEAAGLPANSAEITLRATTYATADLETAQKLLKMLDMLEDLDDVQSVYSNADIPDAIMEQLA